MVALCLTSASASQLSPPPSHPAQSLQLLPRSSRAFQTGYLGPNLAWSLLSEARKHFHPLEEHRGNSKRGQVTPDQLMNTIHTVHCCSGL